MSEASCERNCRRGNSVIQRGKLTMPLNGRIGQINALFTPSSLPSASAGGRPSLGALAATPTKVTPRHTGGLGEAGRAKRGARSYAPCLNMVTGRIPENFTFFDLQSCHSVGGLHSGNY
jgi:hypothetical protein